MARIYVSSTFEDLKTHREAVASTLRQMHHEVICMEDYVATDQRPLDKCLADVSACEIYVGIFALRYGFVPTKDNPDNRSITELEYRCATAAGKERLIFLLDAKASGWPLEYIDALTSGKSGDPIRKLREGLEGEFVRRVFRTPDDLARQVSVAIHDVQQRWTDARLEQQRHDLAMASAERAKRPVQRVAGQHLLDVGDLFHGRIEEQRQLGQLLGDRSTRLVSVIGRAGIGKTALASKVLGDLEQGRWPQPGESLAVNGIVYLSTRTTGVTLDRVFTECAALMEEPQRDSLLKAWASGALPIEEKIRHLLLALDDGVYVILLDHLEDVLDADGRVTDPALQSFLALSMAAARGARLLVTSRTPINFDDPMRRFDRQVPLTRGLSTEHGVAMLRELDPNGLFGLRNLPDEQLARAVDRLHGVPKALVMLAGMKRDRRLRSLDSILDAFYQERLVDELIREGYRRLDADELHLLTALAVLGRPAPPVAAEFMVAPFCPGLNVDAVLGRLIDIYLVTFHSTLNLLSVDAIDQEYALSQLPERGDYSRESLNRRAAEYYARVQIPKENWRTLSDVEPFLCAVQHLLAAQDFDGAAEVLSRMNPNFVAVRGNPQALAVLYERVQGKTTDKRLQALNLLGLGALRKFLGPLEQSYTLLKEAQAVARQIGDRDLEWRLMGNLGDTCRRLGRLDEAVDVLREAHRLGVTRPTPDYGDALILSLSLSYRGDYREAIDVSNSVLDPARQSKNIELEAHVHDGLSLAYLGLGAFDQAYEHAQTAADRYKEAGLRDPLGYVCNVQGMACMGLRRFDEARALLGQGRDFGREDCNPRLEGFCLVNLARLARMTADADEATRIADAAFAVLSSIGAPEAAAALGLRDAVGASRTGDRMAEARALLVCSRASIPSPDLFPPVDLLHEAEELVRGGSALDLHAEVSACLQMLEQRRQQGSAPVGP
jgi:tetratricopeptide (TPR) repeat protein